MKYRLIAADLDGTLLNEYSRLGERTRSILERAISQGAVFVPATGRPACAVPDEIRSISGVRYIISSNGAQIYDLDSFSVIHQVTLPYDTVIEMLHRFRNTDAWTEICIDGTTYVDNKYYDHIRNYISTERSINYLTSTRKGVPSIEKVIRDNPDKLEKLCLFFKTPEDKLQAVKEFGHMDHIYSVTAFDTIFELSSEHANKGDAMYYIADLLNIPHDKTIAFGDGMNDKIMLDYAGLGVAMENSFPGVKDSAKLIAPPNTEEGVAQILEQYF